MIQVPFVRGVHALGLAALLALAARPAAAQPQPAPEAAPSGAPAAARPTGGTFLDAPQEWIDRLTPEQAYRLLQRKLEVERKQGEPEWVSGVVPLAFFAAVILVVWLALQHRSRREDKRQETVRAMIDKGLEVPRELLAPPPRRAETTPGARDLRAAVLLICGGLGLSSFFGVVGIWETEALRAAGFGLIPLFLGLGYLIVWRLGRPHARPE